MSDWPPCQHYGTGAEVDTYAVAGTPMRLCPGCVADARLAGYVVCWLPTRMLARWDGYERRQDVDWGQA